jgi:4-amino-4-deoxy-L-arabinose transferase-like glycosyltransferase
VSLGLLWLGLTALLLAQAGLFSLWLLALLWLAGCAGGLIGLYATGRSFGPIVGRNGRRHRWELLFLTVWLAVVSWLFFRPHEFIIGGADAGVYVNLAAAIARQGSVVLHDPILAGLDPALYDSLLRPLPPTEATPHYLLPGFYAPGDPPGQIIPQFYPYHPVWQAVAYSLAGTRGALMLTGLWALLGSLAVYLTARRVGGRLAAGLTLVALSLNALQIWFARYPTTEALSQYLLWTGLWALVVWLAERERQPVWGLLAGLSWGALFLTRIDMYFLWGAPLVCFFLIWRGGRWRRSDSYFLISLTGLTLLSFAHALWQSWPYFFNTFGYGINLLRRYPALPLLAFAAAGLFLVGWRAVEGRGAAWLFKRLRPLQWSLILLVVVFFIYGWFIRPYVGEARIWQDWYGGRTIINVDYENLRRLAWYLSPLGVGLAAGGMIVWLWRGNRATAVILGVGFFFALLYLWRIQANPHQIYAMRRYVPVVMPFFILTAAAGLDWLYGWRPSWLRWPKLPQATAVLLTLLWLGSLGWLARGFVTQVDYQGLVAQMATANGRFAPNSLIFIEEPQLLGMGDFIGTPLRFLHGHDVFIVRTGEELPEAAFTAALEEWLTAGRTVYRLRPVAWEAAVAHDDYFRLEAAVLEGVYDRRPTAILPFRAAYMILPVTAVSDWAVD